MRARVKHRLSLKLGQIWLSALLIAIMVFALALPVFASLLSTVYPIQDTYIDMHTPDTNHDGVDYILVGTDISGIPPDDWIARGLIEMDISGIPADATIISATLNLYYAYAGGGGVNPVGNNLAVYKLINTTWDKAEATWNIYSTGNNWLDVGGDFVTSSPSGDSIIMPASEDVWLEWDITDIVIDAYDLGIPVELILKFDPEVTGTYTYGWFEGVDYGVNPPSLDIVYTLPSAAPMGNNLLKLFLLPIVAIGIIIAVIGAWAKNPYIFFMGIIMGIVAFIIIQKLIEALL